MSNKIKNNFEIKKIDNYRNSSYSLKNSLKDNITLMITLIMIFIGCYSSLGNRHHQRNISSI